MKKGKLTLGIVLGLLIIVFVVAQAQAVSAKDATRTEGIEPFTPGAAGTFCLDIIPHCDDVKFAYQSIGGGMYILNGWEYGCGCEDIVDFGTMRVVGDTIYIGYTSIYPDGRWMGQFSAQLTRGPNSGPCQWAWHYDGYHCDGGDTTAQIIPCPVSAVETDEPCTRE